MKKLVSQGKLNFLNRNPLLHWRNLFFRKKNIFSLINQLYLLKFLHISLTIAYKDILDISFEHISTAHEDVLQSVETCENGLCLAPAYGLGIFRRECLYCLKWTFARAMLRVYTSLWKPITDEQKR